MPAATLIERIVSVKKDEISAVLLSAGYFFSLLCAYYILRPIRDEMGIAGGVDQLQWLFSATFLGMLLMIPVYGWLSSRFSRRQFLPYVYYLFIACLLGFFLLFKSDISNAYVARAFFVWVSVFNLFVVSVFWSFMADIYTDPQAKRLFGFIAAGGTLGALAGPAITVSLVGWMGAENLLLISVGFLTVAILCIKRLSVWDNSHIQQKQATEAIDSEINPPIGGSIFAGVRLITQSPYLSGICGLVLLYSTLATFIYFQQAEIISSAFSDPDQRTLVFAAIDLAVNGLTIVFQILLTSRIIKNIGLGWTLALIPMLLAVGLAILGTAPVLSVLLVVQVLRRAGNYAIMKPAREILFVVLGKEEKYKAKSVIDTVVYRGGDAVSAWIYSGMRGLGLSIGQIAWLGVPLALLWAALGLKLGKMHQNLASGSTILEENKTKGSEA
jgi:AAA family ATP:ADP antiporter